MAAVDGEDRSGHVGAGVRRQQQQRAVQIGQPAEPALRDALDQRLAGIAGEEVGVQLGLDIAGAQRVDADAVAGQSGISLMMAPAIT